MFGIRKFYVLMDEAKESAGGGGGGNPPPSDLESKLAEQIKRNADLENRLKALEGNKPSEQNDDLADKARKKREADDQTNLNQKQLESAIKFNLGAESWLKDNASLLPKTVAGIFEQASKENYSNAIEKDSAIKSGIISEFFSIQSNVDLLTPGLRSALEEFNKLTKNVKQERAQQIYDNVFEPAFAMLKGIKKAEQLSKGIVNSTDAEAAYKAKLIAGSRKHYLGEKQNGS